MKNNQSPQAKQKATLGMKVRVLIMMCAFVHNLIISMAICYTAWSGPVPDLLLYFGLANVVACIASGLWLRNVYIATASK
jgi:hypothetical protein